MSTSKVHTTTPADTKRAFRDFTERLKLLVRKRPDLITLTLSNIFTMRLIGNKTHGDLAEIGIAEFVNQYMYDYHSTHVGKSLYRAKSQEKDITVTSDLTNETFSISLKAYGVGPLQLSTDKKSLMFSRLKQEGKRRIEKRTVQEILKEPAFEAFHQVNVLPLIYDEEKQRCNILVFDSQRAQKTVAEIVLEDGDDSLEAKRGKRKHPVYRFYDGDENYICEVRYGGTDANALQRGLWTHTKNSGQYFDSITGGWIDYSHNMVLVELFSHALISEPSAHEKSLQLLKENIAQLQSRCIEEAT